MARTTGSERARRLIAIMGRLQADVRIHIADLAADLGATEAELTADLETLSMCGVAPYCPDDLSPLFVEDGYVEVWGEFPALKGPVRLSVSEARALAAALQAAGFAADDELTRRVLEATGAADFDAEELERTIRAATAGHDAAVYGTLAQAVREQDVTRVEYVGAASGQASVRDVEPLALFAERGAWYLTAWCRRAGDWRTFRLDRIRSATALAETFDPRTGTGAPAPASAFDIAGLPAARLRFSPGEVFFGREWPGGRVIEQHEDGTVVVEVPYGGTDWIARHVVARLGAVEVLEPADLRTAAHELASKLAEE